MDGRGEGGYSLVELMVVVAIVAILVAISIPTFFGFRDGAQDRAAQAELRTMLLAEKAHWTDNDVYTQDAADIWALQPGAAVAADPADGVVLDLNDGSPQIVCLARASDGGEVFSIWLHATLGAYFGAGDLSAADCPAAAPAGFARRGF
jgi:prepilin-type N-terminal cleavage/methylation domain-containing protein